VPVSPLRLAAVFEGEHFKTAQFNYSLTLRRGAVIDVSVSLKRVRRHTYSGSKKGHLEVAL
jgi:hypothetical protein